MFHFILFRLRHYFWNAENKRTNGSHYIFGQLTNLPAHKILKFHLYKIIHWIFADETKIINIYHDRMNEKKKHKPWRKKTPPKELQFQRANEWLFGDLSTVSCYNYSFTQNISLACCYVLYKYIYIHFFLLITNIHY